MSVVDLDAACHELASLKPADAKAVSTELVALAMRFSREAGTGAVTAIAQLFLLVEAALGNQRAAETAFAHGGAALPAETQLNMLGIDRSSRPVEGTRGGANSLLALRLSKNRPR